MMIIGHDMMVRIVMVDAEDEDHDDHDVYDDNDACECAIGVVTPSSYSFNIMIGDNGMI